MTFEIIKSGTREWMIFDSRNFCRGTYKRLRDAKRALRSLTSMAR